MEFSSVSSASTVTPSSAQDQACSTDVQCNANGIRFENGALSFALSASTVGTDRRVTPANIDDTQIKVQGQATGTDQRPLEATKVTGDEAKNSELMLLLDTSASMRGSNGDRFTSEIEAAHTFVDLIRQKSPGLSVGIVTFGNKAKRALAPTAVMDDVDQAIDKVAAEDLSQKTDTYGAVQLGIAEMNDQSSRSLLMITDGIYDPEGPKLSPAVKTKRRNAVADALKGIEGKTKNRITFQAVIVGTDSDADIEPLGPVSRLTDNNLQQQLTDFVSAGAAQQEATVVVRVPVPDEWAGKDARLVINALTTAGQQFRTTVDYPIPEVQAAPTAVGPIALPNSRVADIPYPVLIAALVAVFGALALLLTSATGALAGADNKKSAVIRRLEIYTVSGGKPSRVEVTEQTTRLGDNAFTRNAVGLMSRFAKRSRLDDALDGQLEAAGLPLRTAEWMLIHIGIAVFSALLLTVISGGQIAAGVIGLLLGLAGPWLFLTFSRSRREKKFLAQLPDTLQLLAGSLAAGYSLPQAMDSVVRESAPPISLEFNRALVEARLGMLAEDALDGIARRTASTDFSWIVMAIRIQRDVGGNLAELLSTVAETLRERERLRRQVDALSAEGRLSGAILGALPLVFGLYLILTRPDYIAPLFNSAPGLLLLAIGGVMLTVGGFWMSKVIKVKV